MNMTTKRRLLTAQLDENLKVLERSLDTLLYSYEKCRAIGTKSSYAPDEQEVFEALTARFARTADILTQKAVRSLFVLLQENIKTIIDAANLSEKLEIVETADELLHIRELRNQIAHEYVNADLGELFKDVLRYVPELEKITGRLIKFAQSEIKKMPE